MGTASEAVVGIPQLVFLAPAGLFQRIGTEHQHLTDVILLGTVTDAMLRAEQAQLLIRFPIEVYEAIQYGGVTSDGDLGVVSLVLRNIAPRRPLLVGSAETPIPGKLLQGGGQHPFRALVAIFRKHRFKAVLLQVHPVEALTDRLLDGIPAGNIGMVTLAPHGKLISCSGLLCRVGIEIGFVHFTFLPPAFSYHLS